MASDDDSSYTCDVCSSDSNALSLNSFWDQRHCLEHFYDGTSNCVTCQRFVNIGHGQKLCPECSSIAVMDGDEGCSAIIEKVFEFYRSLNLKVDENIPILFIDGGEMNRLANNDMRVTGLFFGVLLFFQGSWNLLSFLRFIVTIRKYSTSGGHIKVKRVVKLMVRDTILILSGQPDVEIGVTLAHEMMHAWLHLQGCKQMEWEGRVREGICNVMGYKWLEWFGFSGATNSCSFKTSEQAQHRRKLNKYLAEEMKVNKDEVYGQGFRDAMKVVDKLGLKTTLDHIVRSGTLPVVQRPELKYSTWSTTAALATTNTNSITERVRKAISNTTNSIANLFGMVTATYETPRFIIMQGHRFHHHHRWQGHFNIPGRLPLSPTLLFFFGILIEHK